NSSLSTKAEETMAELTQAREQIETLTAQSSELQNSSELQAQEITSLQGSLEEQTASITTAQTELDAKLAAAEISLQIAQEESSSLKEELEASTATATEKDSTIQQLTDQASANNSVELEEKIATLMDEAVAAKTATDERIEEITGLITTKDASIQELATEVDASKEQLATLQTTEQELTDSINQITTLEGTIAALTAERDQLVLMTTDSDNDGVSDAKDTCPETLEGTDVNEQGCEKDTDNDGLVNSLDLCPGTASDTTINKAGCSEDQTTVVLEGINFQLGTAELAESAHGALNIAANILQKNPELNMEVAGHTDSIGEAESNLQLSTLRAESVLNYLVSRGVAAERLQAKGYGANEPIADNTSNAGRAKNRRVELKRTEVTE
ncbi:MAG: OmpA family protein, partial [Desulfocapsa sp.]|nr:OmpA family protein [Desulfocapsa sp.]